MTVTLTSQAALDGFQANNGGGNNSVDIRAGNGIMFGSPSQELVTRGFMSFDLSGIPATTWYPSARRCVSCWNTRVQRRVQTN